MRAVPVHCEPGRVYRFHRTHGVALYARYLHQATDGITGQAQVMLHADLGSVLHLPVFTATRGNQSGCRHGTGHTNLTLAAHFSTGYRGIHLVENTDRAGGQQKPPNTCLIRTRNEVLVVQDNGRNDTGSAIGRRRHNPPSGCIFFVDGDGIGVYPVHRIHRIGLALLI